MSATLLETNMPTLKMVNRGKVRDIYDLGEHLLLVTSDRLSAFDVVMVVGALALTIGLVLWAMFGG